MNALSTPGHSNRLIRLLGYLEQDPENVALLRDASDMALQQGCWDEARALIARTLALAPGDPVSRYRKSVLLTHDGDAAGSLALTQALLDEGWQEDAVLFQHARGLILAGRHPDAEPVLEGLLPRADGLPEFNHLYVRALHGAGRLDDAIRVAGSLGTDPVSQGMLSLLYVDADRLREGAELAASVLSTHPDNIDALISAGTVALAMEEADKALPHFERAARSHADNGRAWMGIGLARMSVQDFPAARAAFEKTVRLLPAHLGSWNTLAWIQILQQDYAAADATLQMALRINHNFGETHGTLAVLRAFEQQWSEAKQHADIAVRLQPDSFAGRFAQTLILEQHGRPDKARQLLEQMMRNFQAPAGGNMVDVVRRHAMRTPEGGLRLPPTSSTDKEMSPDPALDPLELKFLAINASRSGQAEQALLYLKQAIRLAPQDGELHYLLGAEHAQLGMYDRAAEEIEHALALAPDMHTARLQLGLLYLTEANVEASTRTLAPLSLLAEDNCYRLFSTGLLHLMHDRFPECRAALEQGILRNNQNDALNGDIQKIIDALPVPAPEAAPVDSNVWLSAYKQNGAPN